MQNSRHYPDLILINIYIFIHINAFNKQRTVAEYIDSVKVVDLTQVTSNQPERILNPRRMTVSTNIQH